MRKRDQKQRQLPTPVSSMTRFQGEISVPVQGAPMTYALMTIAMLSLAGLAATVKFAPRIDDRKLSGLA